MSRYDVIIVGAGVGGLSCAAVLAKKGQNVLVLDAQEEPGGVCQTSSIDGFRFEDGALWLPMAYLARDVFRKLGADFDRLVPTVKIDRSTRCILQDDETIEFSPHIENVAQEIRRISPQDEDGFRSFMTEMSQRSATIDRLFYEKPADWRLLFDHSFWLNSPFLLESYDHLLKRFFKNEDIRRAFTWPTLYLGLHPADLPAAHALNNYGEITSGYLYPVGGMGTLSRVLNDLALAEGVTIQLGVHVEKILVEERQVKGVRTDSGETLRTPIVVSNAHVRSTYLDLIGHEHLSRASIRRFEALQLGLSNIAVQLGLDYELDIPVINLPNPPPRSRATAFWNDFDGCMPQKLFPNVAIPPREARVAPPGCSVVTIVHDAPFELEKGDWDENKEAIGERLIERVEQTTGLKLRGHILSKRIRTPDQLEKEHLLHQGAKYGLAPGWRNAGPLLPKNRSNLIDKLYLAGQTTQPGLGVASSMKSGTMTAELIIENL
jgi:phytoene dehydrogenase-like protein